MKDHGTPHGERGVDLLVFGPHPDDVEISAGGMIASMAARGHRVAIADLTRGETGTRGTPETRVREAEAAGEVLGAVARENLGLPDASLRSDDSARRALVECIRRHRPAILVGPYPVDYHPDHAATGRLLEDVRFLSGLAKYPADGAPWRAGQLWSYMCHDAIPTTFIVDVSDTWDRKIEALRCFASQLHDPDSREPETDIASPDKIERLEARFRYFGSLIGVRYGEPFHCARPLGMEDPVSATLGGTKA